VIVLPVLLVGVGLAARRTAGRALHDFTAYETPFAVPSGDVTAGPARSRQIVVVLVDGLGLGASRGLPFVDALRARGADYDCRIGEPSLSLPGRAVLLSGAWAEVNGQPTNYHPRPLRVAHAFSVARSRGVLTALAAGTGGLRLFSPEVTREVVYAKNPETAPYARYEWAMRIQEAQARALLSDVRGQPGLVMVELHAVDEVGHGWGGSSEEYRRAAAQADEAIRGFASLVDLAQDTLVVTADHGHVAAGGHGGPEEAVMHVPLVLAGAGIRAGARGASRQTDVASTLSTLLGLAVPGSNQGRPLLDALDLDPAARRRVLEAVVAQRERFVSFYVDRLAAMEPHDVPAAIGPPPPEAATASEATYVARLDALDRREAGAKTARIFRERRARLGRAVLMVVVPLALGGLLVRLRIVDGHELGRAAAAAAIGVALYHFALPVAGLQYSLTTVNKDEWLPAFFRKDMALGLAACALAVAAGAWRERRARGADRLDLARFAWLTTALFCFAFVLKLAVVYWTQGVSPRWHIADMRWGFAFYLDVLVVMAVGVLSPLMVLPAWLGGLRPRALPAPATEPAAARGVV
jgi:hypothetical protein